MILPVCFYILLVLIDTPGQRKGKLCLATKTHYRPWPSGARHTNIKPEPPMNVGYTLSAHAEEPSVEELAGFLC